MPNWDALTEEEAVDIAMHTVMTQSDELHAKMQALFDQLKPLEAEFFRLEKEWSYLFDLALEIEKRS